MRELGIEKFVAESMRGIRCRLGMSQGQLEMRSGINRSAICNFEVGRVVPNLETIQRIAKGLGVETWILISIAEGLRDADKTLPTM